MVEYILTVHFNAWWRRPKRFTVTENQGRDIRQVISLSLLHAGGLAVSQWNVAIPASAIAYIEFHGVKHEH